MTACFKISGRRGVGRAAFACLLLAGLGTVANHRCRAAESTDSFDSLVAPFLQTQCLKCHNEKLEFSDLNLKTLDGEGSLDQQRKVWSEVLRRLSIGVMPPAEEPRPNADEVKRVTRWIEAAFERADRVARPNAGKVTARRLNRAEYNNTIRDLLGVTVRPADDFPHDDTGFGFDNIGDVLTLSPSLMEKYLAAASQVANEAVFGPEPAKPTRQIITPVFRRKADGSVNSDFKGLQNYTITDYDFSGLTMPSGAHVYYRFPVDGEYILRALPKGYRLPGSEDPQLAMWIDGEQVGQTTLKMVQSSPRVMEISGQQLECRVHLTAGEHWIAMVFPRQFDGLPPSYKGLHPSSLPEPGLAADEDEEDEDGKVKARNPARRATAYRFDQLNMLVDKMEIVGPFEQSKGQSEECRQKLYGENRDAALRDTARAREIVTRLSRRAFRRPASEEEIASLVKLVELGQADGGSFEEGLSLAIQSMLVSPNFLFRIERSPMAVKPDPSTDNGKQAEVSRSPFQQVSFHKSDSDVPQRQLTDDEFAARLSYFLWSSMPDDELFGLADGKQLQRPESIDKQVRRMLADKKSHALIEEFGGQWLQTRALESVKPDRNKFPDWEDYLRRSMRQETELFFEHLVQDDRSILDFLDAKYTYINERMAQHYGLKDVKGPEFRKVDLSGTPRRGVVTQAGVLTVSSYATRTSPVLRGRWILENVYNTPPPPPPPDVPNLDEEKVGTATSLRQQMEQHRSNQVCASCHERMDPLGFGLENFDGIGLWRTQDGKAAIDPSGTLPDARAFSGPDELLAILSSDRAQFSRCLTEKLLTYALGRGLEHYDTPTVKQITDRLEKNDYKFSSLVLGIVESMPFQMQRVEAQN